MKKQIGRYSKYIRPMTITLDFLHLTMWLCLFFVINVELMYLGTFAIFAWALLSLYTKFYEIFRFTKYREIVWKIIKQFFLFSLCCFSFVGLGFYQVSQITVVEFLLCLMISVSLFKFGIFWGLQLFRIYFNGNLRKVLIIGWDKKSQQLANFFNKEKSFGYELITHYKQDEIEKAKQYISNNRAEVDEVYLSKYKIEAEKIKDFILFCDDHFLSLKYILSEEELLSPPPKVEYYGTTAIMPEYKTPLELRRNKIIKRVFDIVFSMLVIVFVLSWLVPIIAIMIKIESRGPVFFKQKRNGIYLKEFYCYKFRSMVLNREADTTSAVKNDKRITRVGRFIRKTSIDEIPQFFNVLKGDMSVCGPRPHMLSFTSQYSVVVNRYKMRHFVKPGVTGLAQTHGYRGEIENNRDIVNRIKYDVFYIKNWSILLDIKIVFLTIKNGFLGDKKAY